MNSAMVSSAYSNNLSEQRDVRKDAVTKISKQGDISKVEQLKGAIDAGEYKVDLEALSKRIADELM
jgi:anti-sigma28 factor (negative regulator of flagellin synthesis)